MIVSVDKGKDIEAKKVLIEVGGSKFRITESVDGKLTINKYNYDDQALAVYPRYANEIDVL